MDCRITPLARLSGNDAVDDRPTLWILFYRVFFTRTGRRRAGTGYGQAKAGFHFA